MKKNNFKFLSVMIAFVFGAIVFSACGPTRGNLTFKDAQITMAYNQEIDISDLVVLDGCNINDINFISSNPEVVLVTPRKTIIAGNQDAVAILSAEGYNGFLEIQVAGTNLKFDAPVNICFDEATSKIVWDTVYVGNIIANNFTINITKNGEPLEPNTLNTNSCDIDGYGEFEVQVKCNSRDGVGESDFSEKYIFTKLPSPTNLQYNSKTGIVSWEMPEGVTHSYLKKNGVLSQKLTTNNFELLLTDEQTYEISVISALADSEQNVFGSYSETITLTRLVAPQVSISDGVVSWHDEQVGVEGYKVEVYSVDNEQENLITEQFVLKNGASYTYTIPSLTEGEYVVKVCACGTVNEEGVYLTGVHYLNSAFGQTEATTKLAKQSLLFNKQTKTLSIDEFDLSLGLDLQLVATYNNTESKNYDISSGELVFDFEQAGIYNFYVLNLSKSDKEITSQPSNNITVIKLGEISNLTQTEDAFGNYVLNNLELEYATNFDVKMSYNKGALYPLTETSTGYGLTSEIFNKVGQYQIFVTASGDDTQDTFILESITLLNVTKLSTNPLVRNGEQITWQSAGQEAGIAYSYNVTGLEELNGITKNNYFDLSVLNVGAYTLSVTAVAENKVNVKNLILDASNTESITIEIYRQLELPKLSFERDNDGYNLILIPVANATTYTISLNSEIYKIESYTGTNPIVLAIESCFAQAGIGSNQLSYVFEVYASSNNKYFQQSEISALSINKEMVPTTFNVSADEVLSIDTPYSHIEKAQILINDTEGNTLDKQTQVFNIKVKYVAKVQEYEGVYYIDSDYAEFVLERLPVTLKFYGLLATWSAGATTQRYTPYINVEQGSNNFAFGISQLPSIDLSMFNLQLMGFSLNAAMNGYIECIFGKFSGEIYGSYVNGHFVSGNSGELSKYNIGNKSEYTTLQHANANIGLDVIEQNQQVEISWKSKNDATYTLFDGTEELQGLTNHAELSLDKFTNAKKYNLSLTEEFEGSTNIYIFYITRLNKVNQVTVTEDEKLTANIVLGAVSIEVTQNGTVIENLKNIQDSSSVVSVRYLAQDNLNSYEYYLNGLQTNYTFARLSGLNTTSNLKIYNNIISWTKEGNADTSSYVYNVKFFDNNDNIHEVTLTAETTNSIDLTAKEYESIINSLSGTKFISIQKAVGNYVADVENVNYLSSVYSNNVLLKIIDAPTNIKIELAEDSTGNNAIFQNALKISWTVNDDGVEIAGYTVKITHNGVSTECQTDGVFNVDVDSDLFKAEGEWFVCVRALGANDSILSPYSQSASIVRLAPSNNLSMTKAGVIAWSNVTGVAQYLISYKGAAGEDSWYISQEELLTENFVEKLDTEFAGDVTVNLYALGDGTTTLTSVKTAVFTRLNKPVLTYENNKVIVENYDTYPINTKLFVTALIDEKIVLNKEISVELDSSINKYVWYYPTSYSYIDTDGNTVSVDLSTQKDIYFTFEARNDLVQYLYSNKVSNVVTILAGLKDLKIIRTNDDVLHILATNPNINVTNSKIKIGALSWLFEGNVDLELSDNILAQIPSSWAFTVQAVGKSDSTKTYIDSSITTISGTKLETVTNITTKDGAITWGQVSGASDYKLCVDSQTYLTGYFNIRSETLAGKQYTSGDHLINIRAIGNVTEHGLSAGIVLDGDYSLGYTVTKLNALEDFTVENGYFTFTPIQQASSYVLVAYTDLSSNSIAEYTLEKYMDYPDNQNINGYYYNSDLLKKLDDMAQKDSTNSTLYIKVYNKTDLKNYVYSDFAEVSYGNGIYDYVKIARLQNKNERVELYNPLKPDGEYIDYTKTIAKWEQNTLSQNKYIIYKDNELFENSNNSYVLDAEGKWEVGEHTIRYAQVGSNGFTADGVAYLTARLSSDVVVTKLKSTAPYFARLQGTTEELCISYSTVSGADKYYSYLDGEYFSEYSNAGIAIFMDEIKEDVIYKSFAMRAVNTQNVYYIASDMCYLTYYDDEAQKEKIISLAKTSAPKGYSFDDGVFYWSFTDAEWMIMLSNQDRITATNKLSMSFNNLLYSKFAIRFTSLSAPITTYTGVDYVRNYIYVSDEQFATLCGYAERLAPTLGITDDQLFELKQNMLKYFGGGFSSAKYNFSKFASNLPSGAYKVEVKIIGSGLVLYEETRDIEAWFSSSYTNIGTKYVASAPNVTAVANNGKYSLKFTNVNVDSSYFPNGISYNLYGTYYNEEYDLNITKLVSTLPYTNINNSAELNFDLTSLIEQDILTSKYINLFVTVAGNDTNVLNGKTSNIINIQILNEVTAKIERGIIYWSAQDCVSKYQAVYLKDGESESKFVDFMVEEGLSLYNWIAGELEEGAKYDVTLQACGLINGVINNSETFIMSGKLTPIGTVNKLMGISKVENGVDIQNGLFVWDAIENATTYDVYRYSTINTSYDIESVGANNYYETSATNLEQYYYRFMAIGTEYEDLTSESNIYVNSNLSAQNLAQRIGEIRSVSFDNAIISFTPTFKTGNYKLTFYKLNSFGERSEPIVVYTTETNFDTNKNQSLLAAGTYDLDIQAIYKDKKLVETTSNCYYVISQKYSTQFIKIDKVYDIHVGEYDITNGDITTHYEGGVISWAHDNTENLDLSLYEYKLVFKAYTMDDVYINETIKTVPSSQKYFEGVVFDNINTTDKITLEIYVYPTTNAIQSNTNYAYSLPITYGVYESGALTEVIYLHQYMPIDENAISISVTDKSQLMIDWTQGISGSNIGDFTYEISFSIGGVEHAPMTTNDTFYIIGNEDEGLFADDSSTTVVLKIRVIPTSIDYISSAWTSSREITRPNTIEGLTYDETTCTITWNSYVGTSNWDSYKYKIRDEVTYTDVNGDTYVEVYIVTANLGDEKYTPFVIGSHKISVAVMVSNSDEANSDFISAYKTIQDVQFDMFAVGSGTETNPYIILDSAQFKNMQYRMTKDAKLNEYFLTKTVNDELIMDNEKVIDSLDKYYFKQEGHLTLVKNGIIDQTLYNVESESGFNNIYDGDRYSIKLEYTHIEDTTDYEHVSIFKLLGTNAEIKNLKLLFTLMAENNNLKGSGDWADINVLCEQNNGKIENIMIGNVGDVIRINLTYLMFSLSMLASSNYGIITNVQNNYSIVMDDENISYQKQINYAPIAINNYASIVNVKNNGDITIHASEMYIGGLVAKNTGTNAIIQGGANKGNITIYYKTNDISYVGGLVAYSEGSSSMSYCYNIGGINVTAEASVVLSSAYIGGLVGWAAYDNISYSYVNANIYTEVNNFNIYQLIGRLQNSKSNAVNVYYNGNTAIVAVNGILGSGVKAYTTSPLDAELFGSGTLFTKGDLDGNNPCLDWEAKLFKTIEWQEDLP